MWSGRLFQIQQQATLNAWPSTVDSRTSGMSRRLELAEVSARQPGRSVTSYSVVRVLEVLQTGTSRHQRISDAVADVAVKFICLIRFFL